jgi:hypothetical protein
MTLPLSTGDFYIDDARSFWYGKPVRLRWA